MNCENSMVFVFQQIRFFVLFLEVTLRKCLTCLMRSENNKEMKMTKKLFLSLTLLFCCQAYMNAMIQNNTSKKTSRVYKLPTHVNQLILSILDKMNNQPYRLFKNNLMVIIQVNEVVYDRGVRHGIQ